jgi:GT2 family glycosyltransferase
MDLSVIIVNYKTKDFLDHCLESLLSSAPGTSSEIIVIDNDSQDGTREMMKQKYPQVTLIINHANYGFARACNQGIMASKGEYLFFLNPDTVIDSNTYDLILAFMKTQPRIGVAGCYLYSPDGRIQTSFYRFTSIPNQLGRALLLYTILPRIRITTPFFREYLREEYATEQVCGGAMVVRREAIEDVGLFDEAFFLYYEDEDLCYRMTQKGWKIASIPGTRIIHYHDQSSKKNIKKAIFSSYKSQFLFYNKYHTFLKILIFRIIQTFAVTVRSCFWFYKTMSGKNQREAKLKLIGYLSVLLSDFYYRRSLIK